MSLHTRLCLAALLVAGVACRPAPSAERSPAASGLSSADEAAVLKVDSDWARAASAGNGKAVAALYTDDAILLPPNEPLKQGAAAKQYWIDFTNGFSGSAELNTTSVEGGGDVAFAVGAYTMALTPKQSGAKPLPKEEGKYIEVMKRQADGSWKIAYDIWNVDAPPAP